MIHSVYSPTLSTFKSLSFRKGLNLIVAEKSEGATLRQTRNGAGKSSFLEIVHFLLGGSCDSDCIFRSDALLSHSFGMKFDVGAATIAVERNGAPRSPIRLVSGATDQWPVGTSVDLAGIVTMSNNAWKQSLGEAIFGLKPDAPTYSPTFRSLIGFFARRRDDGGFQKPESFSSDSDPADEQTALSYLFGLDWEIPRRIRETRERERSLKVLRKELKKGVYGRVMEPAAELKSKVAVTERRLSRLDQDIREFKVLPEYRDLEREASSITAELSEMANQNTLDEETIDALRKTLETETEPELPELYRVYEEAGVIVAAEARERIDAAKLFHKSVIANRRQHLEGDVEELRIRLERRREKMKNIDVRRQQIMEVLQSHGALDQFSKIEGEATRIRTELEESKKKLEVADRVETAKTDLAIERAQLHKQLMLDHKERDREIKRAILLFEELSEALSEKEGTLTITAEENGAAFRVEAPSLRSGGVKAMQIFCFDLTLQLIASERGISPGFLIHDSHLFDGMDPRQIGKALKIGAERAAQSGFQYIVTINSDSLDSPDVRAQFDPTPYMLSTRLSDATDDGGLFGFRFD
jgi:uncharacterized protein YydD (DUF2326 family)